MKNHNLIKLLNKSHYDKIEEILSFDRNLSGHACILFGVTSDYRVKNEINRALNNRMSPDHSFFIMDISGYNRENYQKILNEILEKNSSKDSFFIIDGLDMLIKKDSDNGKKPDILVFLNYNREFFRDNQIHILFWIREESESHLFDESPDLWAFRNSVFHFDAAPPSVLSYIEHIKRIGSLFSTSGNREEIELKIKAKKNLLKKYERYAPEDKETIRNLLEDLAGLYFQISMYDEAKRAAENALNIEETPRSLNVLAMIYLWKGDFENAMKFFIGALNLSQEQGYRLWEAVSLQGMGNIYKFKHDLDNAIDCLERANKIFKEVDRRDKEAETFGYIGGIYLKKGNPDRALSLYVKALEINREIANREGEAVQLRNIGNLYREKGNFDNALDYQQKSYEIYKEIGNRIGESSQLGNIGILYREKGDFDNALDYHQKALEINKEIGNRQGEAEQLGNIGILYQEKGDFDIALNYQQKSYEIYKEIANRLAEAEQLGNIGDVHSKKGDMDKVFDYYKSALEIYGEIRFGPGELLSFHRIFSSYMEKGDFENALKCVEKLRDAYKRYNYPMKDEIEELYELLKQVKRQTDEVIEKP